ncbi:putative aminotransferase TAT2 [Morus notabilis]|uniref:Putative aminotransferase TAT2 n=1 Tax=Morus notabilis TaxID=981085 RepID=W9QVZ9_9ROSA|nr:putative aminotransferase TAT2 [Morus notabilis]
MENKWKKWSTGENPEHTITEVSKTWNMKDALSLLQENLPEDDPRSTVHLALGDPSLIRCTSPVAEEAVIEALRSSNFNGYPSNCGLPLARRAIAEYLSRDLPYKLSPEDVYVTCGCKAAIETILPALARPGANILLPRPGFPCYESFAALSNLEVRHFDLLPEKNWEVDLDAVEALADENTVAIVIINPGNPCPSIAEIARKLTITVITDEVYAHLTYGEIPFVPMGVFGSIVPVITLGSISKRWMVPGWRLGWLVTTDPTGFFRKVGVVDSIKTLLCHSPDPATFIQGAVPNIIAKTPEEYFSRTVHILKQASEICYSRIKEIPCLTFSCKPEGGMFVMVKLNLSQLKDIKDDTEFCLKLAKEESVTTLPGTVVGLKNWIRISFATELSFLEDGLERIKSFCQRQAKMQSL